MMLPKTSSSTKASFLPGMMRCGRLSKESTAITSGVSSINVSNFRVYRPRMDHERYRDRDRYQMFSARRSSAGGDDRNSMSRDKLRFLVGGPSCQTAQHINRSNIR